MFTLVAIYIYRNHIDVAGLEISKFGGRKMYHPYVNVEAKQKMKDLRRIAGVSEYQRNDRNQRGNLFGMILRLLVSIFK